jgi:hypothetical protein
MKKLLFTPFLLLLFSCKEQEPLEKEPAVLCKYMSYELYRNEQGLDTINFFDQAGQKQGHWIIFEDTQKHTSYTRSAPAKSGEKTPQSITSPIRTILEEGFYENDIRVGYWKKYNENGNVTDSVFYKEGMALN